MRSWILISGAWRTTAVHGAPRSVRNGAPEQTRIRGNHDLDMTPEQHVAAHGTPLTCCNVPEMCGARCTVRSRWDRCRAVQRSRAPRCTVHRVPWRVGSAHHAEPDPPTVHRRQRPLCAARCTVHRWRALWWESARSTAHGAPSGHCVRVRCTVHRGACPTTRGLRFNDAPCTVERGFACRGAPPT